MAAPRYIEGVGRRKSATARVRLSPAKERSIDVNGKTLAEYFGSEALEHVVLSVFATDGVADAYTITVQVQGGGIAAHAEAVRLGIARALVEEDAERRIPLKRQGFLKRDPRRKERKKFGLRKARKAPQWSKR